MEVQLRYMRGKEAHVLDFWTVRWQKMALRGILAILLGIVALFWPIATLELLIILLGVYFVADGIETNFYGLPAGARKPSQ
jgi:uncharacterized membrane protein HdeD (DUF308 family)